MWPGKERTAPQRVHSVAVPSNGTVDPSDDLTSSILFCDDDPSNIHEVRAACARSATLYVAQRRGLESAHLGAIRSWAQLATPGPGAFDLEFTLNTADRDAGEQPERAPPPLHRNKSTASVSRATEAVPRARPFDVV